MQSRPTLPLFTLLALGASLGVSLAGCAADADQRTASLVARPQPAATPAPLPVGNNGRFVSDLGENPINQDYYLGSDPMFPRGSSSGSFGHEPGGGGP